MDEMGIYSKAVDEAILRGRRLQLEAGRSGALFSLNVPVIFILIGGSGKEEAWFRARLRIFLQNPDACVIFSAADCGQDHVADMLEREFNRIAQSPAGLLTITQPIVCPVVFGHRRASAKFPEIASAVYRYIDSQRWTQKWQPFLLLHIDDSRNYGNCKKALSVVSEAMDSFLTRELCCRCCLLCSRNSDGFAVEDENLLNTVILLTLLQGSSSAQSRDRNIAETIGTQLGRDGPEKFYSARAVSIEAPVIPMLLDRIRAVLGLLLNGERFLSDRAGTDCEDAQILDRMDLGFLNEILEPYLRRLPQDNNRQITLLPLYSIMPGEKNQTDSSELIERTRRFYGTYYRDHLLSEEARSGQRQRLLECFLPEYIKAGGSLHGLKRILNQPEADVASWLKAAHLPELIPVAPVARGGFPQGAKPDPLFATFEHQVSRLVNGARETMLHALSEPEPRALLRRRLSEITGALSALSDQLYAASLSQQSAQVSLPLTDTPPERDVFFAGQKRWLRRKLENQQDTMFQRKWRAICASLLQVRQDAPDTLAELVRLCGDIAEDGLSDSESYMQELKQICSRNSNQLDNYVGRIKAVWLFPVRLAPDHPPAIENRSPTGVGIVGNPNNLLCQKLEQVFAGSKLSSITDGDRRIDLVRLSGSFQHDELALWKTLEQQPELREEDGEPESGELPAADTPREEPETVREAAPPREPSGRFAKLSGLTACYDASAHGIRFRWEHGAGLSYPWLYIYQVHRKPDGSMELGEQLWRANLSQIRNQCVVELREMHMQVRIMDYLVFAAASQTEVTDLSAFSEEGYFCRTASGSAQLQYRVDYGEPRDGLRWARVHAVFSSDIPGSMVCYSYTYGSGERTYLYAFPTEGREQIIRKGSYEYLPVLLPAEAILEVKATAPEFCSSLRISELSAKRRGFFFWR